MEKTLEYDPSRKPRVDEDQVAGQPAAATPPSKT
jgi:hypothetical protein